MSEHIPAGATELRFVKRNITVPSGKLGGTHTKKTIEIKLLQSRHFTKLGTYHQGTWSVWADVPLVEPEDEDPDDTDEA